MTPPPFPEALRAWCRVALLSFGGPAGQIAVLHRVVVEEKRWVSEPRFLHALHFCMLLPGPEAQQLATYLGWLLHGWRGGLAAGTLFVLPGFVAILALSVAYVRWHGTPALDALLFGLKAVVLGLVAEALLRLARRALRNPASRLLALGAFAAMFGFGAPFVAVIAAAALLGALRPAAFAPVAAGAAEAAADAPRTRSLRHTLAVLGGGLVVWWMPVALLAAALGPSHRLVAIGAFFGKVAAVSFGGAYAVLSYVAEQAVHSHHWLSPAEMLDGLGMAETTPGPLIMVVQFVGFLAASREPGPLSPLVAGGLASLLVVWVTFVPSFLWIFLGAPWAEHLRRIAPLAAALAAVAAAVTGVIANLLVWFALHVLFGATRTWQAGPLRLLLPDLATFDAAAALIAASSAVLLIRWRWGLGRTLIAGTAAGALWSLVRG